MMHVVIGFTVRSYTTVTQYYFWRCKWLIIIRKKLTLLLSGN